MRLQKASKPQNSLSELALLFLKLGTIAFGGPAAHIAMMEEEVVRRKKWLSHAEFLDLLGATNLIPGPNSTEMAIHLGYQRAGYRGLIVAGICFILPAMLIVLAAAWAYVQFKTLPQMDAILYGIKPVVIAVVLQALWALSKNAVKNWFLALLGIIIVIANFLGASEVMLLFLAGACSALVPVMLRPQGKATLSLATLPVIGTVAGAEVTFNFNTLFFIFLKIGSILFGSGYVLLAFLRAELVQRLHWLNEAQLLDAVAVGQVTPGPVFTTATFIGYLLGGTQGALVATLGIFLPAFFFVAISSPFIPRLRSSKWMSGFLDGVNVASLGLMLVVTIQLGRAALVDVPTLVLSFGAAMLLLYFRMNSAWLVLIGALLGVVIHT